MLVRYGKKKRTGKRSLLDQVESIGKSLQTKSLLREKKQAQWNQRPSDLSEDPHWPKNTKRTKQTLAEVAGLDVLNNAESSVLAIHDQDGENIQYMNHIRRHYNYHRKYTFGDMTAYYKDDGHVYVQGLVDGDELDYIYVLALYENEIDDDDDDDVEDEDDVLYPAWMVPPIKERIMKNELPFMLNRPSDDSNNATLASVKPHGPQDDEE